MKLFVETVIFLIIASFVILIILSIANLYYKTVHNPVEKIVQEVVSNSTGIDIEEFISPEDEIVVTDLPDDEPII